MCHSDNVAKYWIQFFEQLQIVSRAKVFIDGNEIPERCVDGVVLRRVSPASGKRFGSMPSLTNFRERA